MCCTRWCRRSIVRLGLEVAGVLGDGGELPAEGGIPLGGQRVPVDLPLLALAGDLVRLQAQVLHLARVRRTAVLALPFARQAQLRLRHRVRPRRKRIQRFLRDALDLMPGAVGARHPPDAELARQRGLDADFLDRAERADVRAQRHRVRRAPHPVGVGAGHPRDHIVDVVVRLPVAAGVLQPRGDHQTGGLPSARLPPIHPPPVVPGPDEPRPLLQVLQPGMVRLLQDLLHAFLPGPPHRLPDGIPRQVGAAGLLAERRVQDRDGLVVRHGEIGVDRRPPRLLPGLTLQLQPPFPGRVRLSRELAVEDLTEPLPPVRRPAQLLSRHRVGLLVGR